MLVKFEMTNGLPIWVNPDKVVTIGFVLDAYNFDQIEERDGKTYRFKKFAAFPVAGHAEIFLVPDGSGEANTVQVLATPSEAAEWLRGGLPCHALPMPPAPEGTDA